MTGGDVDRAGEELATKYILRDLEESIRQRNRILERQNGYIQKLDRTVNVLVAVLGIGVITGIFLLYWMDTHNFLTRLIT